MEAMRIVSLIASATEMVDALGLGEFQVGRSHECDHPRSVLSLPVCTAPRFDITGDSREIDRRVKETLASAVSVYEVFEDVLSTLAPTHILTQTQCQVCAVSLADVERALSERFVTRPMVVALEPNSLADIRKDVMRVARACAVEERGAALVESMDREMAHIAGGCKSTGRKPRVALIEWQEPLMAAGNWMPELVAAAGGVNLFGTAGKHSPWMSWESLVAADPDVILVSPCGFGLDRTRREMPALAGCAGWPGLRAVASERVYLADGNAYFHRPGPRLVESLEILAEVLHPDVFAFGHRGEGWVPFPGFAP